MKLGDYFHSDRPVLLIMVYFGCPRLCSLSLNGLTEAVRKIDLLPGKQFEIVTVSFNPEEGPALAAAKKENYLKSLGKAEAAAGWHFLTSSDPTAARALGEAIGFGYWQNPQTGQYLHEAGIYFCTPEGRVSRVERGVASIPRCSATRSSTPRGDRSAGAVRRGPGLRTGQFRRTVRQVCLGRHGGRAGHGNRNVAAARLDHRVDGVQGEPQEIGGGLLGNAE